MKTIAKNQSRFFSYLAAMLGCMLVSSASAGESPVTVLDHNTGEERAFQPSDLDSVFKVKFDNAGGTRPGTFSGFDMSWSMELHGNQTRLRETKRENSAIYLKETEGIEQFKIDFATGMIYNRNDVNRPDWAPILQIKSAECVVFS